MAHIGGIANEQARREAVTRAAMLTHPLVAELKAGIRDLENFYRRELLEREVRIIELERQIEDRDEPLRLRSSALGFIPDLPQVPR